MDSLKLMYYDTYNVEIKIDQVERYTHKLTITKNDFTESKSHSSSVEYFLDDHQIEHLSKFIMEYLNEKQLVN